MKKFIIGFTSCFAVFVCLNSAAYVLLSTPTFQSAGFPFRFLFRYRDHQSFYGESFAADLLLAVYCSFRLGRWIQQRGASDYLIGTKD